MSHGTHTLISPQCVSYMTSLDVHIVHHMLYKHWLLQKWFFPVVVHVCLQILAEQQENMKLMEVVCIQMKVAASADLPVLFTFCWTFALWTFLGQNKGFLWVNSACLSFSAFANEVSMSSL